MTERTDEQQSSNFGIAHQSSITSIRLQAARTLDDTLVVGPTLPYYCPSDLQGVVHCCVLEFFARSYKHLATPHLWDGKSSRGARQRLPASTFRPTSYLFRLAGVSCRLDLSKLTGIVDLTSVTCRGETLTPVPHFHRHSREPCFQANTADTINGIGPTEAGVSPYVLGDPTEYTKLSYYHIIRRPTDTQAMCGASAAVQTLDPIRRGYCKCGRRTPPSLLCTTPSWPNGSRRTRFLCAGRRVLLAFAVQIKLKRECPPALV